MTSPTAATARRPDASWAAGGLGVALLSAAAFGTSGTLAKGLLASGWSPAAAVGVRLAGGALVLAVPALLALRGRWAAARANAGFVTSYGLVAMVGVQLCAFSALATLSVGVALLLEYLGVVLVVLWLWARHGRRPRPWTVAGVALSVAGLLLVLDVAGGVRADVTGVLGALAAAVGLAGYFLMSARPVPGLPPLALAAGGMLVAAAAVTVAGALGLVPLHVAAEDVALAGTTVPWWAPVVGLCIVSAATAYAAGIVAGRRLGAKLAGFVGLTEVQVAVLFAGLLLGELPLPVQLAGGVLVVAGVVAVKYDEVRGPRRRLLPLGPGSASAPQCAPAR